MTTWIQLLWVFSHMTFLSLLTVGAEIQIGAASTVINNKEGGWVQGVRTAKCANKLRNNQEANALDLQNRKNQFLIFSGDLGGRIKNKATFHIG